MDRLALVTFENGYIIVVVDDENKPIDSSQAKLFPLIEEAEQELVRVFEQLEPSLKDRMPKDKPNYSTD